MTIVIPCAAQRHFMPQRARDDKRKARNVARWMKTRDKRDVSKDGHDGKRL